MPEDEQNFGTYAISFSVSEPHLTWYAMTPLVGTNGLVTTGTVPYITPLEIELVP